MSDRRGQGSAGESSNGNSEPNFNSLTPEAALRLHYSNLRDETFFTDLSNETTPHLAATSYATSNSVLQQRPTVGRPPVRVGHIYGRGGVVHISGSTAIEIQSHDRALLEVLLGLAEQVGNVSSGLTEETIIELLNKRKYERVSCDTPSDLETCCICNDAYVNGEEIGVLNCGHEFHTNCIKNWLLIKNDCPMCRAKGLAV